MSYSENEPNLTSPPKNGNDSDPIDSQDPKELKCGTATKFWLELVASPEGTARSLWLYVDGDWKCLDDPSDAIQSSVQNAFNDDAQNLETLVWYPEEEQVVHGLVVHSK